MTLTAAPVNAVRGVVVAAMAMGTWCRSEGGATFSRRGNRSGGNWSVRKMSGGEPIHLYRLVWLLRSSTRIPLTGTVLVAKSYYRTGYGTCNQG